MANRSLQEMLIYFELFVWISVALLIRGGTNAYDTQTYCLPSEKAILIALMNTDTAVGEGPLFFATISKVVFPGSFSKEHGS